MLKIASLAPAFFFIVGCSSPSKNAAPSSTQSKIEAAVPAATSTPEVAKTDSKQKKMEKKSKLESMATASGECVSGSDKRTLETKKTEGGGCELLYTKSAETKTIATQVNGTEKCDQVAESIKSKLEAAGFNCAK